MEKTRLTLRRRALLAAAAWPRAAGTEADDLQIFFHGEAIRDVLVIRMGHDRRVEWHRAA